MSLLDKIREVQRKAWSTEGLERLCDLSSLDNGEYLIFCRRGSLLLEKINIVRRDRSPESTLKAIFMARVEGYCSTCYELTKNCMCQDKARAWIQ